MGSGRANLKGTDTTQVYPMRISHSDPGAERLAGCCCTGTAKYLFEMLGVIGICQSKHTILDCRKVGALLQVLYVCKISLHRFAMSCLCQGCTQEFHEARCVE